MSRSNPQLKNPATRFMQWRGGADTTKDKKTGKVEHEGGRLTYWDKEANKGNGAEIEVPLPFSFLVLDELHTITGFNESTRSGFWSNEVKDLKGETLTVKMKSGTVARGTYDSIKDEIKAKGAKYTKSVYIAFKDETGELQIGNLKLAGAALTAWIEFSGEYDVMQCAVFITDEPKLGKKGTNYYFIPVFDGQNISESSDQAAKKLDEELQSYLKTYFNRPADTAEELVDEDDEPEEEVTEDASEAEDSAEEPQAEQPKQKAEPADDGKINLKDVPF